MAYQDPWVEDVVERFAGPLTIFAARVCGDAEAARDVVQDTFLRLVKAPRADVEDHIGAWLYTVCRNRALDIQQRDRRAHRAPAVQGLPDVQELIERADQIGGVLRAIAELPDREQELLRLRFQGGLSYREMAEVSGLTVTNVGYLLHNALRRVRQRMMEPAEAGAGEPGGLP